MRFDSVISNVLSTLLQLLLLALPLSFNFPVYKDQLYLIFFTEPLLILICLCSGILFLRQRHYQTISKYGYLYPAMILCMIVSALFSQFPSVAFKSILKAIIYFGGTFIALRVLKPQQAFLVRLGYYFLTGTLFLTFYMIYNQLTHAYGTGHGFGYRFSYDMAFPFVGMGHSNVSIMLECAVIVGLALYFLHKRSYLLAGIILLLQAEVFMTWSKASLVTSLVTFAVLTLFLARKHKITVMFLVVLPLLLTSILKFIIVTGGYEKDTVQRHLDKVDEIHSSVDYFNFSSNTSNLERYNRWVSGLRMFQNHPWTGVGPGAFGKAYIDNPVIKHDLRKTKDSNREMNIHNLYLGWLVEGGIFVALAGLLLLFCIGADLLKIMRSKPSLGCFLLAFFLMFGLHSLFQDHMYEPRVITVCWMALALLYQLRNTTPTP